MTTENSVWDRGFDDGYSGFSYRNVFDVNSEDYNEYRDGWQDGRLSFEKSGHDGDFYMPRLA